MTFN
jgi:hypothetical protein